VEEHEKIADQFFDRKTGFDISKGKWRSNTNNPASGMGNGVTLGIRKHRYLMTIATEDLQEQINRNRGSAVLVKRMGREQKNIHDALTILKP
jgi:hypothetical protein